MTGRRRHGQEQAGREEQEEGGEDEEEGRQAVESRSWSSPPSAPAVTAAACRRRRHGNTARLCVSRVQWWYVCVLELRTEGPFTSFTIIRFLRHDSCRLSGLDGGHAPCAFPC